MRLAVSALAVWPRHTEYQALAAAKSEAFIAKEPVDDFDLLELFSSNEVAASVNSPRRMRTSRGACTAKATRLPATRRTSIVIPSPI